MSRMVYNKANTIGGGKPNARELVDKKDKRSVTNNAEKISRDVRCSSCNNQEHRIIG